MPPASYRPRHLGPKLLERCEDHPVVVLTGARQTGKTTLLRHLLGPLGWDFVDLDDYDQLDLALREPGELLAGRERVVIDEAQRAPDILLEVKRLVDRGREQVRVVVSGSANLLLMRSVSETLAGRAVPLVLRPFSVSEAAGREAPALLPQLFGGDLDEVLEAAAVAPPSPLPDELAETIWRGGMPPVLSLPRRAVVPWWEGYVATYLERDVLSQSPVQGLTDFRRLCQACALRTGQVLNMADLARDVGVSATTVRRHLDLLEVTHQLARLPAFAVNRTKRIIKSPKPYLGDSGLAAYLSGLHRPDALGPAHGALLEQLVLSHLLVEASLLDPAPRLHHWRTTDRWEVDFVCEWGTRLVAFEVKGRAPAPHPDAAGQRRVLRE